MSLITDFISNNDLLTFNLNNSSKKIKISLANAIRRIILSDIYTYTIDENKTTFFNNTSILDTEFLISRLTLIPIISNIESFDYDNVVIGCKKENSDEHMLSVYAKDFYCKDIIKNETIETSKIINYPDILFAKLAHNQNFSFESKLKKNNQTYGGSSHCPVSTCIYTFKIDNTMTEEISKEMNNLEKRSFMTQDAQRIYERNEIGEPNIYQFVIESIGFYSSKEILLFSIESLLNKLFLLKKEFREIDSKKISSINIDDNLDFFYFLFDEENDTIGNLLQSYINNNQNIFYCGYIIEHPLKVNFLLKTKLKENNNYENIILVIEDSIDEIISILNEINDNIKNLEVV